MLSGVRTAEYAISYANQHAIRDTSAHYYYGAGVTDTTGDNLTEDSIVSRFRRFLLTFINSANQNVDIVILGYTGRRLLSNVLWGSRQIGDTITLAASGGQQAVMIDFDEQYLDAISIQATYGVQPASGGFSAVGFGVLR